MNGEVLFASIISMHILTIRMAQVVQSTMKGMQIKQGVKVTQNATILQRNRGFFITFMHYYYLQFKLLFALYSTYLHEVFIACIDRTVRKGYTLTPSDSIQGPQCASQNGTQTTNVKYTKYQA